LKTGTDSRLPAFSGIRIISRINGHEDTKPRRRRQSAKDVAGYRYSA